MKTWKIEITATDEKSAMKFLKNIFYAFKAASDFNLPLDGIVGDGMTKGEKYSCENIKL